MRDGWLVSIITELQLLVDIITTGQLRTAARAPETSERGTLRSSTQTDRPNLFTFLSFISSVSLLCCHFVSLYKSQPSPELTYWKTLKCSQTLKHREQTAIINVFQRLERAPSQQGLAFLVFVSHTHRHICTSYNGP